MILLAFIFDMWSGILDSSATTRRYRMIDLGGVLQLLVLLPVLPPRPVTVLSWLRTTLVGSVSQLRTNTVASALCHGSNQTAVDGHHGV